MEDLAFMSGVGQAVLAAFSYSQMPNGLSFSTNSFNTNNHALFMTLGHFFTGRAVLSFRLGSGKNTHSLFHILALICYAGAYSSLQQTGQLDSMNGTLMTLLQGTYAAQLLASAAIIYLPGVPRSLISQFIPLHKLGGTVVWLLTSIQVLHTHYVYGARDGNLGCWLTCSSLTQFAYHGVLFCVSMASFAVLYAITVGPRRLHLKQH